MAKELNRDVWDRDDFRPVSSPDVVPSVIPSGKDPLKVEGESVINEIDRVVDLIGTNITSISGGIFSKTEITPHTRQLSRSIAEAVQLGEHTVKGVQSGVVTTLAAVTETLRRKRVIAPAPGVSPGPGVDLTAIENEIIVGKIVATPGNQLKNFQDPIAKLKTGVLFSPFKIRLWSKGVDGPINHSKIEGGLKDMMLLKGKYIFSFDVPAEADVPFVQFEKDIPIPWEGKKVVIQKGKYDALTNSMTIQINIIENPLPLLILIGVAGAGLGLAGWGLADSITAVDKVMVDATTSILILGVAGLAGWFVWSKVLRPKRGKRGP